MTFVEVSDFVLRLMKFVEEKKLTGGVDVHLDCSQGTVCNSQFAIVEKSVSVFKLSPGEKKDVDILSKLV